MKSIIVKNDFSFAEIDSILGRVNRDSIRLSLLEELSLHYLLENDSTKFRYYNNKTNITSKELDLPKTRAYSYWDLGFFFTKNNTLDSAYLNYYQAYKLYREIDDNKNAGIMLLNMAVSQEKATDYIGSEITSIESLKILPPSEKKQIYRAYNNLAVVSNGLENYEQALEYHEKALQLANSVENKRLIAQTLNNYGFVYQTMDSLSKAIEKYEKALAIDNLKNLDLQLYAILLDNLSYTRLKLGDLRDFKKTSDYALRLRDSLKHDTGIIVSYIHQSDYFALVKDTTKAISLLKSAYNKARAIGNDKYQLQTLKQLAGLDTSNSTNYLEKYININDSLVQEERSIRNKFARIRFETDQYIEKTEMLSQQKLWISITAIVSTCGLILLYYYREQHNKFKELSMQKEQQESNEKIYNLLLNQQTKLEEGRQQERKRISGDLHDGILGRLFGTRMGLGFLNPDNGSKRLEDYLTELQNIEKDIRNISHNLSTDISDSSESFHHLIDQLVKEKNEISEIKFDYHFEESFDFDQISNDIKINLYRLVQECLQNAIKHSKASEVFVNFFSDHNILNLSVKDNGKGFDTHKKKKGIGLNSMQFRVEKLNGKMFIKSSNAGTTYIFKIPI